MSRKLLLVFTEVAPMVAATSLSCETSAAPFSPSGVPTQTNSTSARSMAAATLFSIVSRPEDMWS